MKLFLSFSGLLRAVVHGRICIEDIQGQLFFPGCTREYLALPVGVNPDVGVISVPTLKGDDRHDRQKRVEAIKPHYDLLVMEMIKAKEEGRASFRPLEPEEDWDKLDRLREFLSRNGIEVSEEELEAGNGDASTPRIRQILSSVPGVDVW
ncbi:MAG: hypothetical protein ABIJ46_01870 [bacterium]